MKSIKVLGICGSPRKKKSSRFLLDFALEAAEATAHAPKEKGDLAEFDGLGAV